jgi:hypothetical protein
MMLVLVCGSRDWADPGAIYDELHKLPRSVIRHGGGRGADRMAGHIASRLGHIVQVFNADWERYGRRAGIMRNIEMLDTAPTPSMVLAFRQSPDSRGTNHTIAETRKRGIPIRVITPLTTSVEDFG